MEQLETRIAQIISHGIRSGEIPGACVGVGQKQERLLWKAYGERDKEQHLPMEMDTLFRAFSLTKPVTAVVTMQLWEQGKLDLRDPVWWYLPSFREKWVDEGGTLVPAKREIWIQDLLNMTSGIPYPDCNNLAQRTMATLYDAIHDRLATAHPMDTQEYAHRVGEEVPLLFQPGARWSYGASADILGAVLERVCDMPLGELFRKRVFEPLGMVDTDFYIPSAKRYRLAQLYAWDGTKNRLVVEPDPHLGMTDYRARPAFFSAGAGLVTTPADYMQFADMLAGRGLHRASGTRLMGENTWRYLTTPQLTAVQKQGIDWPQLVGYTYGNLLRILDDPVAGMTNVPVGEFGWDGWTGPYVCISPSDESVLLYMIQVCGGSTSGLVRRLRAAVYGTLSGEMNV